MTLSDGQRAIANTLAAPAEALIDAPQIADAIEKGVNAFMEAAPVLMKALDEVAKVHPFISGMNTSVLCEPPFTIFPVAVLAFKAVYTLEVKRRSNDKRVIALYAEYVARDLSRWPPSPYQSTSRMKNVMAVLVQYVLPSTVHRSPD